MLYMPMAVGDQPQLSLTETAHLFLKQFLTGLGHTTQARVAALQSQEFSYVTQPLGGQEK